MAFCKGTGFKDKLYDNVKLISREEKYLAFIDWRRAYWYLDKGLATLYKQDEYIICQLNFQNNPIDQYNPLEIHPRKNECSICGCQDRLTKHHIIPYYAFKLFGPNKRKGILNILAICFPEHRQYEMEAHKSLHEKLDIILAPFCHWVPESENYKEHRQYNSYKMALLKYADKIPKEKIILMEDFVKNNAHLELFTMDNKIEKQNKLAKEVLPIEIEKNIANICFNHFNNFFKNPGFLPIDWKQNFSKTFLGECKTIN